MKWPAYPRYKPSGVEWLGQVPEHWNVKPLGRFVRFRSGATPDKSKPEYWDGEIPWISPKDMKQQRITDVPDHISQEAFDNTPLTLLPIKSILIVVRGMILAHSFPVAITDAPLTINQDMRALTPGHDVAEAARKLADQCKKASAGPPLPQSLLWSCENWKALTKRMSDQ